MIIQVFIVALFTLLGTLTQTIMGFGLVFFTLPILLLYFDPPVAIAATLLMGSLLGLLMLFGEKRRRQILWPVVLRLSAVAIPGQLLGVLVVTNVDKHLLQIIVGILIIFGALIQEYGLPKPTKPLGLTNGINVVGLISGFLNSTAVMAGPPLALWLRSHIVSPNQVRDNLAATFLVMNTVSITVISFLEYSAISKIAPLILLFMLPIVLIGHYIGKIIVPKINPKKYRSMVLVAVILAGVASVLFGVFA